MNDSVQRTENFCKNFPHFLDDAVLVATQVDFEIGFLNNAEQEIESR